MWAIKYTMYPPEGWRYYFEEIDWRGDEYIGFTTLDKTPKYSTYKDALIKAKELYDEYTVEVGIVKV